MTFESLLSSGNVYEQFIFREIQKYVTKKLNVYLFKEDKRPSKTRNEAKFDKSSILNSLESYINSLWEGIEKRLAHFDHDGSTNWSEAPAEGIFSILSYIVEHKPRLTVKHMFELCRIVKEAPAPATKAAVDISKKAINKWQEEVNRTVTFVSERSLHLASTSSTIAKILKS